MKQENQNQNQDQDQDQNRSASGSQQSKDPSRVEAGKKTAETRGRESLAEAGRKGGQHAHQNQNR